MRIAAMSATTDVASTFTRTVASDPTRAISVHIRADAFSEPKLGWREGARDELGERGVDSHAGRDGAETGRCGHVGRCLPKDLVGAG